MPRTERQRRKSTVEKVILSLEAHKLAAYRFPLPILRSLSYKPPSTGYTKEYKDVRALPWLSKVGRGLGKVLDRLTCLVYWRMHKALESLAPKIKKKKGYLLLCPG